MSSINQVLPGIYHWVTNVVNPEIPMGVYYLVEGNDRILIDPALPTEGYAGIDKIGTPTAILLTSESHDRQAAEISAHYNNIPVYIEASLGPVLEGVTYTAFKAGDKLPGGLQAIHADGFGETAFLLNKHNGVLFLGDLVIDMGEGLKPLPSQWIRNQADYQAALRLVAQQKFEVLLPTHGVPQLQGGHKIIDSVAAAIAQV